jgi:putative membrane protein
MRSPRRLLLGAALAGLAACGPQNPEQDAGAPAAQHPAPEPAASTAPIVMAAADYVASAAAGDLYEIESSRLALQNARNPEVKAFAQMMVDEHTKSSADLKTAMAQSGQTLTEPAGLPPDRQALIDALNAAGSNGFDAAYLTQQVQAHEAALKLHQTYAQSGDVASLRAFASATVPLIQRHLDAVRQLRDRTVSAPATAPGTAATAPVTPAAGAPPAKAAPPAPAPAAPPAPTTPAPAAKAPAAPPAK